MLYSQESDLIQQLERGLLDIDKSKYCQLIKCTEKITFCKTLILTLRSDFVKQMPISECDQVQFFKRIKPKFTSELYFQQGVFDYLKANPKGSVRMKKTHIKAHLDKASNFTSNHSEFNTYLQLGLEHLDSSYFTITEYSPKLHIHFEIPQDPHFNSPADITHSKLIASDRLIEYLHREMHSLDNPTLDPTWENMKSIHWDKSKTDLVELIYALYASGAVKGELKGLFQIIEKTFNMELGNFYRIYTDIKLKKEPTAFVESLKSSLLAKIRLENQ